MSKKDFNTKKFRSRGFAKDGSQCITRPVLRVNPHPLRSTGLWALLWAAVAIVTAFAILTVFMPQWGNLYEVVYQVPPPEPAASPVAGEPVPETNKITFTIGEIAPEATQAVVLWGDILQAILDATAEAAEIAASISADLTGTN